jgi:hypothetical protein
MAASYPSSVKSFSTKSTTDVVEASHPNDLQDEVTALETALLTTGLEHNLFPESTGDARTLGTASKLWGATYTSRALSGGGTTSSIATATATTIFAATTPGVFLVTAYIVDAGAANYTAAAYVLNDNTNARLVTISNGAALTITLSGTNVQVTQTSGANATVSYTYLRVGGS